ncbi:MAG TPA: hypothetical protein DCM05_04385 [Elusimicrobia bacterium]|nr:hypothetical protein [Elusimicrobiota bacterium]
MKPFRAFGLRAGEQFSSERIEREASDLSTFTERLLMKVHSDAVMVAPPQAHWTPLAGPVPGRLVQGTLPGDNWARFLLRLPKAWNGRLAVAGSPGLTGERGLDLYWSDTLVKNGCAFACTDKGVRAAVDGDFVFVPQAPENSISRWVPRLKALAELAREECRRCYGREPSKTYAVGVSNGGWMARRALEEGFVDGGVEVSGVYWTPHSNLLRQLPAALKAADAQPTDRDALKAAGFPSAPEQDAIRSLYRFMYWEATLALCLGDLDPAYSGACADYDLFQRPKDVVERLQAIANTGELKKPLLSLAGKLDCLVTLKGHAEAYRDAVKARGASELHRLYPIDKATHVDKDSELFPGLEPLMPHAHNAFELLLRWVEGGHAAPDQYDAIQRALAQKSK